MLSSYFGGWVSPLILARQPQAYTPQGLVLWKAMDKFLPKMQFVERVYVRDDAKIQKALKDPKCAVMLEVDNKSHWIVAKRKALLRNDYVCQDPWTAQEVLAVRDYRNITGFTVYRAK